MHALNYNKSGKYIWGRKISYTQKSALHKMNKMERKSVIECPKDKQSTLIRKADINRATQDYSFLHKKKKDKK